MQGRGASATELGLVEMQVLVERLREENHQLSCRNIALEEQCRHWKRSFVGEEDLIFKLKEEVAKLVSKEERLMEKNRKQREEFESEEKRLCEEVQMVRERCLQLVVAKGKLEVDLEAVKREMKKMEAAVADMDKKDSRITSLTRENEGLQMAKRKIEEEWHGRILKLKKDLTEQIVNSLTSSEPKIDMENSGQKAAVVSQLDSPKEKLGAGIQSRAKPVSSEDTGRKIQDGAKHSPAVTLPSNAETQKHLKVAQGREPGARSIGMQGRTKCCKSSAAPDGKLWKNANKMFNAFTANDELCMKSVCALYRKHMSLGPWKNDSTQSGNRGGFKAAFETRGIALGKFLTIGDPEGKMKKTSDELERDDPTSLNDCYDICRHHYRELFEIYEYNLDPLFVP